MTKLPDQINIKKAPGSDAETDSKWQANVISRNGHSQDADRHRKVAHPKSDK